MNPFFCIPYSTPTQYTTWFKIGGCNTTKLRLRVWLSLLLSLLFGAMVNVERILYFSGSYKILDIFLSTLSVTFVNIIWYHLFFLYFSFTLSDIHMTYTALHFFSNFCYISVVPKLTVWAKPRVIYNLQWVIHHLENMMGFTENLYYGLPNLETCIFFPICNLSRGKRILLHLL